MKLSDGEGYINRYKFSEGLKNLGITNELLIEQVQLSQRERGCLLNLF
jgi:hypothetical protein